MDNFKQFVKWSREKLRSNNDARRSTTTTHLQCGVLRALASACRFAPRSSVLAVIDDLIAIVVGDNNNNSNNNNNATSVSTSTSTTTRNGDYRKLKVKLLQRVTMALLPNVGLVRRQRSMYRTVRQLKTPSNNATTTTATTTKMPPTSVSSSPTSNDTDDDDDLNSFVLPQRFEELIDILLTALHDVDGDGNCDIRIISYILCDIVFFFFG